MYRNEMPYKSSVPICISVSSSDASGAAGIQADLKTFSALGCYGASVVTGIGTPSREDSSDGLLTLDPDMVVQQFKFAIEFNGVHALKVGDLHTPEIVKELAREVEPLTPYASIVVDPSFISRDRRWTTGGSTAEHIRDYLLPFCTITTPNIAEAEWLLGKPLPDSNAIEQGARELLELGPKAVLIKGGQRHGAYSDDLLAIASNGSPGSVTWFRSAKVSIDRATGSGCTLSSGIAAGLAAGKDIVLATEEAKIYLTAALRAGSRWNSAGGSGPLHHFYAWWNDQPSRM